jgi:hypothetical protein
MHEVRVVTQQQDRPLEAANAVAAYPHRMVFVVAETFIALGGAAGAVQLMTGTYVPPVSDLEPLGLSSWVLPGALLFGTVAVPSATAAYFALRRRPATPTVVLVASGLLLLEVTVQIPFIGPSVLQAVFGTAALGLAGLALHARKNGWRTPA